MCAQKTGSVVAEARQTCWTRDRLRVVTAVVDGVMIPPSNQDHAVHCRWRTRFERGRNGCPRVQDASVCALAQVDWGSLRSHQPLHEAQRYQLLCSCWLHCLEMGYS